MLSLSDKNQANVIEVLKIDNSYFEQMVVRYIQLSSSLIKQIRLILKPFFGLGLVHNQWQSFI